MNILATQYSLQKKALEIYLAGCLGAPHCKNCHNPESWNFNQGTNYLKETNNILQKITDFNSLIDNIYILGGEPLDQPFDKLTNLLTTLKSKNKDIWLFTRYEIEEIPWYILKLTDYVKCGRYIEEYKSAVNHYGVELASTNQKIYKKGIDY